MKLCKKNNLYSKGNCQSNEEAVHRTGEKSIPATDCKAGLRIHEELQKLNAKEVKLPVTKWADEMNRQFSREEVQPASN